MKVSSRDKVLQLVNGNVTMKLEIEHEDFIIYTTKNNEYISGKFNAYQMGYKIKMSSSSIYDYVAAHDKEFIYYQLPEHIQELIDNMYIKRGQRIRMQPHNTI